VGTSSKKDWPIQFGSAAYLMHIFVDYDGTLTDEDTLDVLTRQAAGEEAWNEIDECLERGEIQLRDALQQQLVHVRSSIHEADTLLQTLVVFDPSFAGFVEECHRRNVPVTILSSGVEELILLALARNGIRDVPVIANTVEAHQDGWILHCRDNVPNGTDKAGIVSAARTAGFTTVFIGDGYSDYDAALAADIRFAKRGRPLERFLCKHSVEFATFTSFAEITHTLFSGKHGYG